MSILTYKFPLSRAMGKIRIKERLTFSDYGVPVPPTRTIISPKHYIEWQIGYDRVANNNESYHFIGANGKMKCLYELSEFLDFAFKSDMIARNDLLSLYNNITNNHAFIDREQITRTNFIEEKIGNIDFLKSSVSYPLLIHKFSNNDLLCEIIVREKQYAVGTMPMLYFCIALSDIKDCDGGSFIGRYIKSNECGYLEINQASIAVFMQMFRIFGMLSKVHQYDCLKILEYLLEI